MSTSRRTFLKGIAATVGAGIGVLATQQSAFAVGLNCCRDSSCPTRLCKGLKERYRCQGCNGRNFCDCFEQDVYGQCFTLPCP